MRTGKTLTVTRLTHAAQAPDPYHEGVYDALAQDSAARMISAYSSSFGLASRLLRPPVRDHVRNIYALVRLADEVVDGRAGVRCPQHAGVLLDRLQADTEDALVDGYSANLIVHAFALTARECGIEPSLTAPFFASMRTDLTVREHDADSFKTYVYGSAEVVGLMCLRVFLAAPARDGVTIACGASEPAYEELATGARRLGAAFQKANFLRDLRDDYLLRGRCYLPGVNPQHFTEADKRRVLDDIDADLREAAGAIAQLPHSSRRAVATAHHIFVDLSRRLRDTPAEQLLQQRVRVTAATKLRIALSAGVREKQA